MKQELKFKHDADTLMGALGVSERAYVVQLATAMDKAYRSETESTSVVSEMVHKEVDYNIILMLATNQIIQLISNFQMPGGISTISEN